MKNLNDFIDDWGMICVRWPNGFLEGGDTVHNMWTYIYCLYRLKKPFSEIEPILKKALKHTEYYKDSTPTGIPIRHPDKTMWYSDPDRCSRDAFIPKLIGLNYAIQETPRDRKDIIAQLKEARSRLFKAHAKNFFLYTWNTRHNGAFNTWRKHIDNDFRQHPHFKDATVRIKTLESYDHYARYNYYRVPIPSTVDGEPILNLPDLEGTPITYERTWDYRWKMPDITGPDVWGLWIRAYPFRWMLILIASIVGYFFLRHWAFLIIPGFFFLAHLENFLATVAKYFYNGGDDRNHFLITDYYNVVMPFPLTRFSKWLYNNTSPIEERFRAYWERPEQSAPLHTYMIDVKKLWNEKSN